MTEEEELAAGFETQRSYLHAIAFRVLGSHADADDAVQEAWLRLARTGGGGIEDLRGWLTTVTGRICLDVLRRRGARAEQPLEISTGMLVREPAGPADGSAWARRRRPRTWRRERSSTRSTQRSAGATSRGCSPCSPRRRNFGCKVPRGPSSCVARARSRPGRRWVRARMRWDIRRSSTVPPASSSRWAAGRS